MIAYFARQSLAAALSWLLTMFLIYSLIIPSAFNLFMDAPCIRYGCGEIHFASCPNCGYGEIIDATAIRQTYAIDEIWPVNYLTWIFGSSKDPVLEYHPTAFASVYDKRTYYFERSTVITGNWGKSMAISQGSSVLEMYGIDLPVFLASLFVPLIFLMFVAVWQRRGRAPIYLRTAILPVRYRVDPFRPLG